MLVICNGAIKSGSTWLYNLLGHLGTYEVPDESYLTLKNPRHPCIRPDRMVEFLERVDFRGASYLSKNHIDDPGLRDRLVAEDDVYVFDIERDPKDVAVSHYYHERFRHGFEGSFAEFYWTTGRRVAASLNAYHDLWRDQGPRVYISSYERLHQDFEPEAQRIAAVLGRELSLDEARDLREKTSLKSLRKDYAKEPRFEGDKFFRKGSIGDWKTHFDDEMLRDMERIQARGLKKTDLGALKHRLAARLRR